MASAQGLTAHVGAGGDSGGVCHTDKNRSFPGKNRLICIDFRLILSLYFIAKEFRGFFQQALEVHVLNKSLENRSEVDVGNFLC
jgi:hypothetical protein